MATSIGEGAARGIEAGFGMGQAFLNRRDQEEQRRLQREQQQALDVERQSDREFNRSRLVTQDERLARQDLRQVVQDERQQGLDAEGALAQEFADLQAEGKGLLEQHGDFGKVPKDFSFRWMNPASESAREVLTTSQQALDQRSAQIKNEKAGTQEADKSANTADVI